MVEPKTRRDTQSRSRSDSEEAGVGARAIGPKVSVKLTFWGRRSPVATSFEAENNVSKCGSQANNDVLRQPAEITVDDHIRLLRQYNKTKDVGQQLIGLIAESRSLPIGAIYKDGDYGVCADD